MLTVEGLVRCEKERLAEVAAREERAVAECLNSVAWHRADQWHAAWREIREDPRFEPRVFEKTRRAFRACDEAISDILEKYGLAGERVWFGQRIPSSEPLPRRRFLLNEREMRAHREERRARFHRRRGSNWAVFREANARALWAERCPWPVPERRRLRAAAENARLAAEWKERGDFWLVEQYRQRARQKV